MLARAHLPVLVAGLALSLACPPASAQEPFALVGATVHAGDGSAAIPDAVVIVREGRIAAVGPAATTPVPAGVRSVDVRGKHVTPGLIDTHVHYSQTGWVDGRPDASDQRKEFPYTAAMADNQLHPERYHLAFLHAGVTAVFDVGGYPWTRELGARTERDPFAPHVAAAGALLATLDPKILVLPDQQQFFFPQTPDEARELVRHHKAWGSAAIKVWYVDRNGHAVEQSGPWVHAAGEEAKAQGLPLIVHSTTLATARDAVAAGAFLLVHSVEDRPVDDEFVAAAKAQGTFYCPTLTVSDGYLQVHAAKVGDEVHSQLDDVHPSVKARVLRTDGLQALNPGRLAFLRRNRTQQLETMQKNLVRLHDAGVRVVLGTDAGNPLTLHGPSIFVELEAMQKAGLPAKDVLVAATRDAAMAMGRGADLGLIGAGRIADLLVLDADPEQDVKAFRSLSRVVRAGVLHERAALLPRGQ
jgi:imidazolonepropionase-like amidohydrolase